MQRTIYLMGMIALLACLINCGRSRTAPSPFTGYWTGSWEDKQGMQNGSLAITVNRGDVRGRVVNDSFHAAGTVRGAADAAGHANMTYTFPGQWIRYGSPDDCGWLPLLIQGVGSLLLFLTLLPRRMTTGMAPGHKVSGRQEPAGVYMVFTRLLAVSAGIFGLYSALSTMTGFSFLWDLMLRSIFGDSNSVVLLEAFGLWIVYTITVFIGFIASYGAYGLLRRREIGRRVLMVCTVFWLLLDLIVALPNRGPGLTFGASGTVRLDGRRHLVGSFTEIRDGRPFGTAVVDLERASLTTRGNAPH